VIRPVAVLAAACGLAVLGAGAAAAAQARVSVVKAHRGTTLIVFGTQFAPPNEFCTPLAMRIDGTTAKGSGRVVDDYGSYAIRIAVPKALGMHRVQLRQTCENGNTGAKRLTTAGASFRVIP
jgi:hypothetical protein